MVHSNENIEHNIKYKLIHIFKIFKNLVKKFIFNKDHLLMEIN